MDLANLAWARGRFLQREDAVAAISRNRLIWRFGLVLVGA